MSAVYPPLVGIAHQAPGSTLAVYGPEFAEAGCERVRLAERLEDLRALAARRVAGAGHKHVVVYPVARDSIRVEFLQGIGSDLWDLAAQVCLNSAGVAVAAAEAWWGWLAPDAESVRVQMGGTLFTFTSVAA